MDRTSCAVIQRLKRRGKSRWMEGYSLRDLERIFGVDHRTIVRRWIEPGLLVGRRWSGRGPQQGWLFQRSDLEAFVRSLSSGVRIPQTRRRFYPHSYARDHRLQGIIDGSACTASNLRQQSRTRWLTSGLARSGFDRLVADVGLGRVGLVLGIEVSRLARNNRDWYHLLDLCAIVDTLIGDADGLYHPGVFNDRLLLGLKGTMSEVELHLIQSRLNGGLWEAARRGELRTHLPVGLVYDHNGQIAITPDEAIRQAIALIFSKFAELVQRARLPPIS
jgi:DNA invertase Pin-like site-specific DNA recombinase